MTERLPDMQEVYQSNEEDLRQEPVPDVSVRVENQVRTQALPAQSWAVSFYDLTTTETVRVGRRDPRRKRLILNVTAQAVWIAPSQPQARSKVGYRMGATDTPIEITHSEEIWAVADTNGAQLSVLAEYWTG